MWAFSPAGVQREQRDHGDPRDGRFEGNNPVRKLPSLLLMFVFLSILSAGQALQAGRGGRPVEIKRPTAEAADSTRGDCSGGEAGLDGLGHSQPATTYLSGSTMPNFYDSSGESTYSSVTVSALTSTRWKQQKFTTWQSASGPYSALVLRVVLACSNSSSRTGSGNGMCSAQYSTNAGSTWTTLPGLPEYVFGPDLSQTTYSATLSASQNLSQLQVRACYAASLAFDSSATTTTTLQGYDIRTEGTLAGGARSTVTPIEQ